MVEYLKKSKPEKEKAAEEGAFLIIYPRDRRRSPAVVSVCTHIADLLTLRSWPF